MICLPPNIAPVLGLASKESSRYSLTGLRVEEKRGNAYQVVATDGKVLGLIRGQSANLKREDMPPGDTFNYLIGTKALVESFRGIKSGPGNLNPGLGVACTGEEITLATDVAVRKEAMLAGRFPEYDLVMPKKAPTAWCLVNPDKLIAVLKAAKAVAIGPNGDGVDGDCKVCIMLWGPTQPFGVTAQNASGQWFDGIVMPMS